jgi:serine/threonine-protein kinase
MSPAASDPDALLGRLLADRYRIESELARGGMATVYRAIDQRLDRPVAVKVLGPRYAEQPAFVERFLSEARVAASLSHPNLAHVYDFGSDGSRHFIAMELLEQHVSLRSTLQERGPLEPVEAARIGLEVLAALGPLHEHGLVHCDVKPGNVMVSAEGAKLIDFGIARPTDGPTRDATSIGSLQAMSPEQLRGEALTPASDLFAVGVLLYEALTGRAPFPGTTPEEVATAQGREPEPPSHLAQGIGPRLDGVVLQALRHDPRRRFASAQALSTALGSALAELSAAKPGDDDTTALHPIVTPPPAAPHPAAPEPPAPPRGHRSRGPWILAAAALVAVPAVLLAVVLAGMSPADGRGDTSPSAEVTVRETAASAAPTPPGGMVRVPNTIGMTEEQAQAAAEAAGLAWRIEWRRVPGRPPGIYRQDPEAGALVPAGSPFVMQAYRQR